MEPKNAICYLRVSRLEKKNGKYLDKESPKTQLDFIKRYCKTNNYRLLKVFKDLDYSGGNDERPAFQRMFNEIKANKEINTVIVYSLSRFARNVFDLNKYLIELNKYNVDFVSCTEEFLRTDNFYGKFLINIIGSVAQLQREQIAQTVRDNMISCVQNGKYSWSVPPLGYSLNVETKKYDLNEEEANVVQYIFDQYIKGKGVVSIRNDLNSKNLLGRNDYSTGTIHAILKNVHYTGDFIYAQRRNISRTKKKKTSPEEWLVIENNHPTIISHEKFHLVQQIREKRQHAKPENLDKRLTGNQMLSGLLICSSCGHHYYHCPKINNRKERFDYYVCGGYKTKGKPYCYQVRGLRIDILDPIIINCISEIFEEKTLLEMLQETEIRLKEEISEQLRKITENEGRLEQLKNEKQIIFKILLEQSNKELIAEYERELLVRSNEIKRLENENENFKEALNQKEAFDLLEKETKKVIDMLGDISKVFNLKPNYLNKALSKFIKTIVVSEEEEQKRIKLSIEMSLSSAELWLIQQMSKIANKEEIGNLEVEESLDKVLEQYLVCVYTVNIAPSVSRTA
ncbi:recombinase family protein [Bacillus cereus]|uniref:recombinase family protein n=1 Tax=Bacillus cereus TaxID=1396 RepID=UPI001EEE5E0D|nr:recombinase family protein [Bacillus cereus]BCB35599.1 serine recombinase [Bacillus cereus]BCB98408.1 serine recombinase [Bacillus cereus]BCC21901.1 serine recombinase [Bacillus cereus]BCC33512.1 serine recombinase [Bacillus cereus]